MAFELKSSACEDCGNIVFSDTTRPYNVDTNPTGYGGPGAPASPSAFQTYTVSLWAPGVSLTSPATYTLDLLPPPTADSDGDYQYTITPEDIGVTSIVSGLWYFAATAFDGTNTYADNLMVLFTGEIQIAVDKQMMLVDPGSECGCAAKGMLTASTLSNILRAAKHAACCGKTDKAQSMIDWLYKNHSLCCH